MHIDTHGKCYVSKFPCPGNDDHASFCFVGIAIVFPRLWLIASECMALWNFPLWRWLLLYYFFFKAHQHPPQMLHFKMPVSWEWWWCLMLLCFVRIPIVFPWLWVVASECLALWNLPLWRWLLLYYFFFKAHRHPPQMLHFKMPVSWKWWWCLILFLLGFQ